MPDVELRADYDRDGLLTGRRTEYAARATPPGAIVVANLDHDGRALPPAVSASRPVALDSTASTKRGDDLDPLQIVVNATTQGLALINALMLRIRGDNATAAALIDARGRVVTAKNSASDVVDYALPVKAGRQLFKLEARLAPGSPLGAADAGLTVEVVGVTFLGEELVLDTGRFRIAPFIVLDDLSPASRIYICEMGENAPAIGEVERALGDARPSPTLVQVPLSVSSGDAWLQDQFQLGYFRSPGRLMTVVLHLPRMRSNTLVAAPGQQNLGEFVRGHFPSTDLGLIEDFWRRELVVSHVKGTLSIRFPDTQEIVRILRKLYVAEHSMWEAIDYLCAQAQEGGGSRPKQCDDIPTPRSVGLRLGNLPDLLRRVNELTSVVRDKVPGERKRIDALRDACRADVKALDGVLGARGTPDAAMYDITLGTGPLTMDGGDFEKLASDISRMHDSLVYGGNIEASPPTVGAPLGKVVVGEGEDRLMDPPLRDMLAVDPSVQPVVGIDTSWLGVGHVDELITFLPDVNDPKRHVVLRASPEVAQELIREASFLYLTGLPDHHIDNGRDNWRPLTLMRHSMHESTHPITRLFRGKHWLHFHPPDPTDVAPPPNIYRRLVKFYSGLLTDSLAPLNPEPNETSDRYPAALSAWDWLYFDAGSNSMLVEKKLTDLDKQLVKEFPSFDLWRVPVLFDRVDELGVDLTAALSPNLVNLQYVNGVALIPRPFGPRMSTADAIKVIRAVLAKQKLSGLAGRVTPAFVRRERLAVTEVWVNREMGYSGHRFDTARRLAEEFRDGWPKKATRDDITKEIIKANRGEFDRSGNLRDGWRKIVIPENKVDLFQAYTHVLLTSLGVRPGWIDSWFYHVRAGEIHCGTNVLRAPPKRAPAWWAGN